jgi:hypothetical protein
MYLLTSVSGASGGLKPVFDAVKIDEWKVGQCVMSSASLVDAPNGVLAAWETQGQVFWTRIDRESGKPGRSNGAPGKSSNRKHPVVASNAKGEVILAWTEGMDWDKAGSLAWQVYDKSGRPIDELKGKADGVPKWSLVATFARPDGGFTVVY